MVANLAAGSAARWAVPKADYLVGPKVAWKDSKWVACSADELAVPWADRTDETRAARSDWRTVVVLAAWMAGTMAASKAVRWVGTKAEPKAERSVVVMVDPLGVHWVERRAEKMAGRRVA